MPPSKIPGPLNKSSIRHSGQSGTHGLTHHRHPGPVCVASTIPSLVESPTRFLAAAAVTEMLNQCRMPLKQLTDADYQKAAKELGVDVESVKAVARVEDPKHDLIYYQGRITILFERHIFRKHTCGIYDEKNPDISAKSEKKGYGRFAVQYDRLTQAHTLNSSAALEAASWGRFQLLGESYKECGFKSVEEMVFSLMESEQNQLEAFVRYVTNNKKMLSALQKHDWTTFAKKYNGPNQKHYDTDMKEAWEEEVKLSKKLKSNAIPP